MTKKNRFILLSICVILFFTITPVIVFYSLGYRFDFNNQKIVATGGIYVKAQPNGAEIFIDSKTGKKIGFFSDSVFVQNLTPDIHNVLIKKAGYFDYKKELPVAEKEVTKLENVLLFKEKYALENIETNVEYFLNSPNGRNIFLSINKNDNFEFEILNINSAKEKQTIFLPVGFFTKQKFTEAIWSDNSNKILIKTISKDASNYHIFDITKNNVANKLITIKFLDKLSQNILFNPQNSDELFFAKNNQLYYFDAVNDTRTTLLPILKDVAGYKISDNNIVWLSFDGFLYKSKFDGQLIEKLNLVPYLAQKNKVYNIFAFSPNYFIKENYKLLWLNPKTKSFEIFSNTADDLKLSPSWQDLLYFNNSEISIFATTRNYLSKFDSSEDQNLGLGRKVFSQKFTGKIANCFWLNNDYLIFNEADKIKISEIDNRGNTNIVELPIDFSVDQFSFNPQNKKVYFLSGNSLFESEKLY